MIEANWLETIVPQILCKKDRVTSEFSCQLFLAVHSVLICDLVPMFVKRVFDFDASYF